MSISVSNEPIKKIDKKLINLTICAIIMVGFRFLPPFGQITPAGMQILGIFLGSIYGWVTVDLMFPSLLGMFFIGLTEITTTTEIFSQGWGSQMVVMTIVMLFVTAAVQQLELTDVIVSWLMGLKVANGRPWIKFFLFMLACLLISIVSVSVIAAIMFVPLYRALMEKANIPAHHRLNNAFMAGITFSALFGDMCLPFKPMALMGFMIANPFLGDAPLTMGAYLMVFPIILFFMIIYTLLCKYLLRIDASLLKNVDLDQGRAEKISARQKWFLIILGLMLFTLVAPSILPSTWKIAETLNTLGIGGISIGFFIVFSLVHINGEPLIDIGKLAKDFSWGMVIMMAYFTPVGSLLTNQATGINATITQVFGPFLGNLSPIMFVIAVGLCTSVLTNFFNNGIVSILFMTLSGMLANSIPGLNLGALCVVILMCSVLAAALPSACPTNAFVFSHRDIITFKGQAIHAIICCTILCLLATTVGYYAICLVM